MISLTAILGKLYEKNLCLSKHANLLGIKREKFQHGKFQINVCLTKISTMILVAFPTVPPLVVLVWVIVIMQYLRVKKVVKLYMEKRKHRN